MKKTQPRADDGPAVQPAARLRSRSRPTKAEDIKALSASLRPLPPGVQKVIDGKKLSNRVLQVAHVIEAIFTVATVDPARSPRRC